MYQGQEKIMTTFFSQEGQDKYLANIFNELRGGFFVDVGAHDGISINNTLYFEQYLGWTGINIEPLANVFKQLIKNRPNCINLCCAIYNHNNGEPMYVNSGYTEMLSGLVASYDPRHFERKNYENSITQSTTVVEFIPTRTLASIFEEYKVRNVNYLSIDVEGAEAQVIESIDFDKVSIDVIGFENNFPDKSEAIVKFLEQKGYSRLNYKGLDIIMRHGPSPNGREPP